jgi:uncharacterized protein YndB with AHSA1/START domain
MTDNHELAIERQFDVPPEAIWTAWTDHLAEWWCPRPWTTEIVENDMRPGGVAHFRMRGPGGEVSDMPGVYLEVSKPTRIVFTNAFAAGWQPQKPFMVGIFEFLPDGAGGTRYRASARHWDAETSQQHADMGFHDGWGAVADQLLAVARRVAGKGG